VREENSFSAAATDPSLAVAVVVPAKVVLLQWSGLAGINSADNDRFPGYRLRHGCHAATIAGHPPRLILEEGHDSRHGCLEALS